MEKFCQLKSLKNTRRNKKRKNDLDSDEKLQTSNTSRHLSFCLNTLIILAKWAQIVQLIGPAILIEFEKFTVN